MFKKKNKENLNEEEKKLAREKFRAMFKKNRSLTRAFEGKDKEYRAKRFNYYFKRVVLIVVAITLIILLSNRTFFKETYSTKKINIKIPILSFFIKDDGNEIVLKTLRKTRYVQDFFDDQLKDMPRYRCDGYSFFYDDDKEIGIYSIKVDKGFIIKTITIEYAKGDAHCLCNAKTTGKEAEEICENR